MRCNGAPEPFWKLRMSDVSETPELAFRRPRCREREKRNCRRHQQKTHRRRCNPPRHFQGNTSLFIPTLAELMRPGGLRFTGEESSCCEGRCPEWCRAAQPRCLGGVIE